MKEDYLITIHGTMEQNGESDSIKLMTRGSFVRKGGNFFITYNYRTICRATSHFCTIRRNMRNIFIFTHSSQSQNFSGKDYTLSTKACKNYFCCHFVTTPATGFAASGIFPAGTSLNTPNG